MQGTAWALVAPIAAIILAILTKEVYISLFSGVFIASILYCNFNLLNSINTTFNVITQSVDEKNMKIILLLVLLGTIVVLVNKSGGTKAYGKLASKKIKTKKSSLLTTQLFAIALFIDDYFGCLTTGNVMNPITDKDILNRTDILLNPEYLICVSHITHNAIHYGDENLLITEPIVRTKYDTCPWKL